VIDVQQAKVTKTIAVAGDPHMILLSPDGRLLYATQPTLGRVAVIAAKTGQSVCTGGLQGHPTVLALSPDATVLYAAGNDGADVSALDPATCRLQKTYRTDGPVYGLVVRAMESTSNQLWVTGPTSLSIFDVKGPLLDNIPIAGGPQFLSIPDAFNAYVTTRRGTVVAIDLVTLRVFPPLLSGGKFGPIDYSALTGEVFVPDAQHNLLDVLNPLDGARITLPKEPRRVIHTDGPPEAVAITNDGLLGFVALQGGRVAMLDLFGRQIVHTFTVGGTPHFIITGLYPPSIASTAPKRASLQQKTMQGDVINIVFYGLATVLFIFLLYLLWHFRKHQGLDPKGKDGSSRPSSKKRVRRARRRIPKKRA
jgi:DNA-binding beta-propeller fold protein YncE